MKNLLIISSKKYLSKKISDDIFKTVEKNNLKYDVFSVESDSKELNEIDDELKAIYHSKDTVCFYIFKTKDLRNEFVDKTKGMEKTQREEIFKQYLK